MFVAGVFAIARVVVEGIEPTEMSKVTIGNQSTVYRWGDVSVQMVM